MGGLPQAQTVFPGTYVIVADAIPTEKKLDIKKRERQEVVMELCNDLGLCIDPHENNFIFLRNPKTKRMGITIIDTEHFPTFVGMKEKHHFKNHRQLAWRDFRWQQSWRLGDDTLSPAYFARWRSKHRIRNGSRKSAQISPTVRYREIGISPTTLTKIEKGHIPDQATLQKVCDWIGEDVAKFTAMGGLQIAFKKKKTLQPKTAQSLANLIKRAEEQFKEHVREVEGHWVLLRRGFKSQCEKRSANIREELSLAPDDPLLAFDLSTSFDTTVWSERDIEGVDDLDIVKVLIYGFS